MSHGYVKYSVIQEKHEADINNGDFYRTTVFSETIADDGRLNLFIKTKRRGIVLHFEAEAGGFSQMTVTEGASLETAGSNATATNLNRLGAQTATATISEGSSFSNGTAIYDDVVGYAAPGPRGAGAAHPGMLILAGSEHYAISLQNLSGGATSALLGLNFTDVT